jgi:predicted N-acyltransferase
VRIGPVRPETIPQLAELRQRHGDKYGLPGRVEGHALAFRAIVRQFGDRLLVAEAALDGAIVGFTMWIRWRRTLASLHLGADYGRLTGLPLFFALAFYEPVEWAMANGVRWIELGGGGMTHKLSRGCTEVRRSAYVKRLGPAPATPGRER